MVASDYTPGELNIVDIKTTETSIPWWMNQVVTVIGIRDYSDAHGVIAKIEEKYMFTISDIRKMPADSRAAMDEFVQQKLWPENLVSTRPVLFFEGFGR